MLVGFVDRSKKLIEVRRLLHRPDAIERRTEHLKLAPRQEPDGHDSVLHEYLLKLIAQAADSPDETFGEQPGAHSFALASVIRLRRAVIAPLGKALACPSFAPETSSRATSRW
jgi:hypothetical protein